MQTLLIALVVATTATVAGCSSSSDDDDNNNDNAGTPTAATLDTVLSVPANSQPVDDGLDQVNADLLSVFGDANSTPVEFDEDETVTTFVSKQGNR